MSNKIYLIHGFNIKDGGAQTTDTVRPLFEEMGYQVIEIDYGFMHLLRSKLCNPNLARAIANLVEEGSTCVAHSNGGALAYRACEMGAPFKNVILVNPALDKNKKLASQVENIQIWYSPNDFWTGIARYIPKTIWGSMGRKGYTGEFDERIEMFDEDAMFGRFKDEHSGIWQSEDAREVFVNEVDNLIKNKGA